MIGKPILIFSLAFFFQFSSTNPIPASIGLTKAHAFHTQNKNVQAYFAGVTGDNNQVKLSVLKEAHGVSARLDGGHDAGRKFYVSAYDLVVYTLGKEVLRIKSHTARLSPEMKRQMAQIHVGDEVHIEKIKCLGLDNHTIMDLDDISIVVE